MWRYLRDVVVAGPVEVTIDAGGVALSLAVVAAALLVAAKGVAFR